MSICFLCVPLKCLYVCFYMLHYTHTHTIERLQLYWSVCVCIYIYVCVCVVRVCMHFCASLCVCVYQRRPVCVCVWVSIAPWSSGYSCRRVWALWRRRSRPFHRLLLPETWSHHTSPCSSLHPSGSVHTHTDHPTWHTSYLCSFHMTNGTVKH